MRISISTVVAVARPDRRADAGADEQRVVVDLVGLRQLRGSPPSATRSTRSWSDASRITIANSSPPRRPHCSLSPISSLSRCDTCASSRSPTWWPSESLTDLKRSRSIIRNAQRVFHCVGVAHRLAERLGQHQRGWAGRSACRSARGRRSSRRISRCSVTSGADPAEAEEVALRRRASACPTAPTSGGRPSTSTCTSRLEKLSRRFSRSARSCRLGGNWPLSHALPATSWMNDPPSIAAGSLPERIGEARAGRTDPAVGVDLPQPVGLVLLRTRAAAARRPRPSRPRPLRRCAPKGRSAPPRSRR